MVSKVVVIAVSVVVGLLAVGGAAYALDTPVHARVVDKECDEVGEDEDAEPGPGMVVVRTEFANIRVEREVSGELCALAQVDMFVVYYLRSGDYVVYSEQGGDCLYSSDRGMGCGA